MKNITRPEDLPHLFAQAWNERDARNLANLFAEDAEFVNVVGLWWHRREDIFKAHHYGLKVIFKDSHLNVSRTKVKMLKEDIALVHAKMHLRGQSTDRRTEQPEDRYNLFSFVVMRQSEGWECVSAHNTDIIPGAETNIVKDGTLTHTNYRTK